jgi:hypothetical protein
MSELDETGKRKLKNGNQNQIMFNQLAFCQPEQIPKEDDAASNRNHQLESMQSDWDATTQTPKACPNMYPQPALVINYIGFIVWVNSTPTELLQQWTSAKSRWPPDAVGLSLV